MTTTAQIAQTAFNHLAQRQYGTCALSAMIGARGFAYDAKDNGDVAASFWFKMCRKAKHCTITYDYSSDLYDLAFHKVSRDCLTWTVVHAEQGLYAEDLRSRFESFTGLALGL